jgi:Flp pilus assembly pilin Flp
MNRALIRTYLVVSTTLGHLPRRIASRVARSEKGQASAEYALVLLGAAAVALIFGKWATGNDTLKRVFSTLLERIMGGMDSVRY